MKLTCDDLHTQIHYYIDHELDEAERVELEAHLFDCPSCRAKVEAFSSLKQSIKTHASCQAPDALRSNIMAALAAADHAAPPPAPFWSLPRSPISTLPLAASLAIAATLLLVLPAFTIAPASSSQHPAIKQAVDWHRGDLPLDVKTADSHHASRWLRDKVDFPVRLPRFDVGRARLLGARLAHVQDRRAVYALYEVDGGARLSVMMFHGEGFEVPSDKVRELEGRDVALMRAQGFDVAVVQDQGVTYTFTSDLPDADFLSLMRDSLRR
jgi:anti-sigma factor RsiW